MSAAAIPALPAAEVRAALHQMQWERAAALLAANDRALRASLAAAPADPAPWRALLAEHDALMAELLARRDEAADALARLRLGRRRARAYGEAR
ncbi:hypothetical protein [Vulcaniibacterium tengchongense]|uniref:hypothetical protein n=1 Tax=Vulcaniibacterium tengchongense TaxID=1273429 RepID=UPI0011C9BF6E|nr:hypothetical protein [Vulcaniibacterium tengchongense]